VDRVFPKQRSIETVDDYAELLNSFYYNGMAYGFNMGAPAIQSTLGGRITEPPAPTFVGHVNQAYKSNGPIFACELVRMSVFSSVRFTWQRMLDGAPSDIWANDPQLRILQRPWANATTQDLLIRMILDADLAGNAYITYDADANELVRLRPDWVDIVLAERSYRGGVGEAGGGCIGWRKLGFVYTEGGYGSQYEPVFLDTTEVAHFHPNPDPLATYRGMSWLTPILMEIAADRAMTKHQRKFFDNGATVNMIVKYERGTQLKTIEAFRELFKDKHEGIENAYKTLHLAPGADPVPVGTNLKDIDFKSVRGGGETRIAAAAGVPPVIAGFSEGLEAATYANYSQARRRFADGTMHPLWQNAAGSLESVLELPDAAQRLWYDATNVPFLREDEKDAALIQQIQGTTINTLITAGYEPDSIVNAVLAQDWRLLSHTGLTSVQLTKPGDNSKNDQQKQLDDAIAAVDAAHNNGGNSNATNN
jgi:HK97 family phage portal protein